MAYNHSIPCTMHHALVLRLASICMWHLAHALHGFCYSNCFNNTSNEWMTTFGTQVRGALVVATSGPKNQQFLKVGPTLFFFVGACSSNLPSSHLPAQTYGEKSCAARDDLSCLQEAQVLFVRCTVLLACTPSSLQNICLT